MLRKMMLSIGLAFIFSCASFHRTESVRQAIQYPSAEREFRAAWVATVANINWPSKPGLSVEEQKAEAIKLLNLLERNHFNGVVLQVRPQCDALYQSELEPWSYYLTGRQGKAPEPLYDPLQFWIEEAHRRGIELHAWLNPYRAHHPSGGEIGELSIVKKKPQLVVPLKNGYWWLDPAKREVQEHSLSVVLDIVRRYDIDGIHFDDYFYPYPSYNDNQDFPDDESWQAYVRMGGKLSRSDWRRQNVNHFIKRVYQEIKSIKPQVKFGLSPFGIWRPNHPPSIRGFDQYDVLYADAKLWLNQGWIDYYAPQLYWSIRQIPQSYPVLLGWWQKENKKQRHLWPGINIVLPPEKVVDETLNQIMVTRGILPDAPGNIHWSIGPLVSQPDLAENLVNGPYRKPALPPAMPWLDNRPPSAPQTQAAWKGEEVEITWSHQNPQDVFRWVVYYQHNSDWEYEILNFAVRSLRLPVYEIKQNRLPKDMKDLKDVRQVVEPLRQVLVTAVDRLGNESAPCMVALPIFDSAPLPALEKIIAEYASKKPTQPQRPRPAVKLGITVLLEKHLDLIRGKRVGLITNPSAVDADMRSDIDLLAATPGVTLTALFGAEHGVRGAEQGKIFQDGDPDAKTGIPIYSLYGDSYAPKQQWLQKIDVMIFDIQGVGSAWYTFKYSMSFAMEACAKAGIPFIVLDRPNPLGGEVVEGPYLELGDIFRHKLPLRHGLTYGELATMWNETEKFGANLTVIKMEGWRRSMMWHETGLPWVMPSPNMDTFETAVVYPGQCLFERSNISEGRGTTKPFLLTGAPWIDGEAAAADLNSRHIPGALFRPAYFIPRNAEVVTNPRGKPWNRMCAGVEVMLYDYKTYRSVAAALHIFDAYRKTNLDSLRWSPPSILKRLEKPGTTVEDIIHQCQDEVKEFEQLRRKYFLYR